MTEPGMVIVGAGKAGARAIVALREHRWSGDITLIGDELHPPYDRPPLSKAAITAETDPEPAYILDSDLLKSLGVNFIPGNAAVEILRSQKTVRLADGRVAPYRRLLLATGARARPLQLAGALSARILRNLEHTLDLRREFSPGRNVVIVGGGFIGLELAASASTRGSSVTVIEAQPRIMMRGVPETIAAAIAERHASAGVSIITAASIDRVEPGSIRLHDGRKLAADILVAGIGALPETSLAHAAGLAIDNGIATDAAMRTSDSDIFAAGDCCSFPHSLYDDRRIRLEAWRSAQDQGAVAAENMLGGERLYVAVPWFWSDQYELTLQIAGLPGDGVSSVRRPLKDGAFIEFHFDAGGRLVCASGIGRGNAIARDIRLAEMLIAKRARPLPAALADSATGLKSLLAA